jgi:hypothetical protein
MFCWLFRLMISHALDVGGQPSGLTRKHVRLCAGCRRFYETCQSLAEDLRREAAIASHKGGCEALSGGILAAVTRRRRETYKVAIKLWPIVTAASVGLVVLASALFLPGRHDNGAVAPSNPPRPTVTPLPRLASRSLPQAWPQAIEKPLAGEMKNLMDDTESAVRFLVTCVAMNLPSPTGEPVN